MNPLSQLVQSVFSDNSNIMLAAIISLLLVILFVLLLHVYARWFLAQAQPQAHSRRSRRRRRVTVSGVLGPARFHHFHNINIEDSPISSSRGKGLDSAIIAAIPVFIYEAEAEAEAEEGDDEDQSKHGEELECVICLSAFEDGEIGRSLPKCGHAFHVECIDMWLNSHSNCPICRAPIVGGVVQDDSQLGSFNGDDASTLLEIVTHAPSSEVSQSEHGDESGNGNGGGGVSGSIISETSSSLLGFSLKRMLSQVFQSSNVNESDA